MSKVVEKKEVTLTVPELLGLLAHPLDLDPEEWQGYVTASYIHQYAAELKDITLHLRKKSK